MMRDRVRRVFRLRDIHWVFLYGEIIIVGSVMSFGIVAYILMDLKGETAIWMLAMIPFMVTVYSLVALMQITGINKKLGRLLDAIHEVAEGNLDVNIDTRGAQEYHYVYNDFNLMVRELKQTREEMENFVNEFAHEFKTPITSISGFSDYLYETGEGIEDEERMEYLKVISEQSKRLCHLSQNALILSKVEAMQFVEGAVDYDLAEQIRECVILFGRRLEEQRIDVEIDDDFTLPYNGNKELMDHIWINLLSNAIKFTPRNGVISISGKVNANQDITVCIADSGIGMDEETQKKIFDKYYQNDSTSVTKGSGIGLAIVRRISELCGGRVWVESVPEEGSRFFVFLPKS